MTTTDKPTTAQFANIVGASEIARRAGLGPAAVANWAARYESYPKPIIARPGVNPLWWWPDVEAWITSTRPHITLVA